MGVPITHYLELLISSVVGDVVRRMARHGVASVRVSGSKARVVRSCEGGGRA